MPALRDLYDEIWIYGLPQINKPLTGIEVPPSVRHKMVYTGYLHRDLPLHSDVPHETGGDRRARSSWSPPGGGGDGADLIDWVLAAYESDPHIPYGAVIVFGPFMSAAEREAFKERAAKFRNIRTLTFTNNLGALMQRAAGVVAMGGYNTFCEILSFDKKAIIVPRTKPRLEQFIRARAARNVGLIEMLDADRGRDPHAMATALRQLPQQGLPSDVVVPGLLDGLGNVCASSPSSSPILIAAPRRSKRLELTPTHPPSSRPCRRRAPGPDRRPFHVVAITSGRACRGRAEGLAAPVRDLHRPGDRRAGGARRGAGNLVAAPADRQGAPSRARPRGRPRRLPAGISEGRSAPRVARLAARRAACRAMRRRARKFLADLRRDPTSNRLRRWGQALVLAAELPGSIERLYAHFLHTPASVTRYAAAMRGLPWSVSAHAKDIWTSEPWEVAEKLADCAWLVTCTAMGLQRLRELAPRPDTAEARLSRPRLRPPAAAAGGAAAARRQRPRRSRRHPVDRPQGREEGLRRSPGRAGPAAARRCTGASSISAAGELGDALKAQAAALGIAERCPGSAPSRRSRCSPPWRAPTCSCWRARRPPTATRTACPTC